MNGSPFAKGWVATHHDSVREVACRALLAALFVSLVYQFPWGWLRFLTSEAVLRISAILGMTTERVSSDTIRIQGSSFRFVIACTFVDVFMGAIPLIWNLQKSVISNIFKIAGGAVCLFAFNILRLEIANVLYVRRVPWLLADEVLGGVAYFLVWLVVAQWSGLSEDRSKSIRITIRSCISTKLPWPHLSH